MTFKSTEISAGFSKADQLTQMFGEAEMTPQCPLLKWDLQRAHIFYDRKAIIGQRESGMSDNLANRVYRYCCI